MLKNNCLESWPKPVPSLNPISKDFTDKAILQGTSPIPQREACKDETKAEIECNLLPPIETLNCPISPKRQVAPHKPVQRLPPLRQHILKIANKRQKMDLIAKQHIQISREIAQLRNEIISIAMKMDQHNFEKGLKLL